MKMTAREYWEAIEEVADLWEKMEAAPVKEARYWDMKIADRLSELVELDPHAEDDVMDTLDARRRFRELHR